jgi:hypothetical protein
LLAEIRRIRSDMPARVLSREHFRHERLAARRCEQPMGKHRRSRCPRALPQSFFRRLGRQNAIEMFKRPLLPSGVVEVVGDPASQLSNHLHLCA